MLPKITSKTIQEASIRITKLSEKSSSSKNPAYINDEISKIAKKQPELIQWFASFSQACANRGLDEISIVAITVSFLVMVKAFILQDEISELEKLFRME